MHNQARALQICDDTSRAAEEQHLEEVFIANGFPEQLVKKTLSRLPSNLEEVNQPEERPKILHVHTVHPWHQCMRSWRRNVPLLESRVVFKPQITLRQLLVHR